MAAVEQPASVSDPRMVPARNPIHPMALPEQVLMAVPDDEREWVELSPNVHFRPLLLDTAGGSWCNLLRVRQDGVLARHRHVAPVIGYVLKGRWRYLEHDWVAEAGAFVFEPPGETHTLVVEGTGAEEMITFFRVDGCLIYTDPDGIQTGYDDVFTRIDQARAHYEAVGLGADFVERFVR